MNPTRPTNVRGHEESRSARNEDHDVHSILRSRTEEEKQRRRREWQRQQERERQHEKLKQQKILEYERKRAQALGYAEQKSLHRSRSKSSSKSPSQYRHRGRSMTSASKSGTLFDKLDGSTSGSVPLFKGPEGVQISTTELRRIKVDIRRNIPTKGPTNIELQRSILNAEEVVLKRRDGEGSKPIFDREEIKKPVIKINEVEERRTVVAVDGEQSVSTSKPQTSKKHSPSLSPPYSSGYLSSHQSRYRTDSKRQDNRTEFRDHHKNNGRSSIEKHREYKEKYAERDAYKYNTNRSRSRERDSHKSHSRSIMEERSYRDRYRDRSNEHSRERRDRDRDKDRDRDRSRERRDVAPHYIEPPIHVPFYAYNLPPRPIVVSPMVPFPRGQVPPMGRGRHSGLMAPVRPFPPRFIPPDMYRLGPPPPNPRYGPF
ncbi:unnamed protein product [Lasius platythorax]|uniref:Feminizer n=1 Tax=Lasius platythorax TaxID=488582 RepID=A0AAV2NVH8_9HYME